MLFQRIFWTQTEEVALNQITVPGWAGADSWKEHSCAWAGASSGLWRRLSWREEYFLMDSCQVPGTRRPPTAVGPFFLGGFFFLSFFDAEPGKAGAATHLRQAWTLFNLRTLRFGELWTLSRSTFFYKRHVAYRRHCTHNHKHTHTRTRAGAFYPLDKGIKLLEVWAVYFN